MTAKRYCEFKGVLYSINTSRKGDGVLHISEVAQNLAEKIFYDGHEKCFPIRIVVLNQHKRAIGSMVVDIEMRPEFTAYRHTLNGK